LEIFDAVRGIWPPEKPLAVALNCHDGARGGFNLEDAVTVARRLKAHGCNLIQVLAGFTVPDAELPYGRGFLTPLSERIRNEVGIPTLVGGYLTTTNQVNTILAGGRADLCLLHLDSTETGAVWQHVRQREGLPQHEAVPRQK